MTAKIADSNLQRMTPIDFNLEETDWTSTDMEESPSSKLKVNKTIENKGKIEFENIINLRLVNSESENNTENEYLDSEKLSEYLGSLQIKSIPSSIYDLAPIPECASCEEYSIIEDSSNLIPTLDSIDEVPQKKREGSFELKLTKTLSEIKERFLIHSE